MNPEYAHVLYLSQTASDVSGYSKLPLPPIVLGTETTLTGAGAVGDGDVLIKAYCSDCLGLTVWPAGVWTFKLFGKVSSATDVTQIKVVVYQRESDGTETELFNATSAEINATTVAAVTITHTLATPTTTTVTDRLVIKVYHLTDSATSKTTTLYLCGQVNQSRVLTPINIPIGNADMFKQVYDPDGDGHIPGSSTIVISTADPLPLGTATPGTTGQASDAGHVHPSKVLYSEDATSNPPTNTEILAAFGDPSIVGPGYIGIINDNGNNLKEYLASSDGAFWWIAPLTKAYVIPDTNLNVLAFDTFTDTDGVSL